MKKTAPKLSDFVSSGTPNARTYILVASPETTVVYTPFQPTREDQLAVAKLWVEYAEKLTAQLCADDRVELVNTMNNVSAKILNEIEVAQMPQNTSPNVLEN